MPGSQPRDCWTRVGSAGTTPARGWHHLHPHSSFSGLQNLHSPERALALLCEAFWGESYQQHRCSKKLERKTRFMQVWVQHCCSSLPKTHLSFCCSFSASLFPSFQAQEPREVRVAQGSLHSTQKPC